MKRAWDVAAVDVADPDVVQATGQPRNRRQVKSPNKAEEWSFTLHFSLPIITTLRRRLLRYFLHQRRGGLGLDLFLGPDTPTRARMEERGDKNAGNECSQQWELCSALVNLDSKCERPDIRRITIRANRYRPLRHSTSA